MITNQEIEHFKSIGYKEIMLDKNKNPRTSLYFISPYYLLDLEENKIYFIDKSIIKN